MLNIKNEIKALRDIIYIAYRQGSILDTIVLPFDEPDPHFSAEADKLVAALEGATLRARRLAEACYADIQPMEKQATDYERHWAQQMPGGKVEVDGNGWVHIVLDTLLPHCKRGSSSPWLRDTLTRLLLGYRQSGKPLPHFERAMLIIDEHCDLKSRRVFDADNKGWKVIPNVLKGLVIADDDQFSLGVALIATRDDAPACHITVMDAVDAGAYFSIYHGDCGTYFSP